MMISKVLNLISTLHSIIEMATNIISQMERVNIHRKKQTDERKARTRVSTEEGLEKFIMRSETMPFCRLDKHYGLFKVGI